MKSTRIRSIIITLLSGVIMFSIAQLIIIAADYRRAGQLYADLRVEVVTLVERTPAPTPVPTSDNAIPPPEESRHHGGYLITDSHQESAAVPEAVIEVNFDRLSSINPESIAWIWIPGTDVNYPLMLTDDNDKYLYTAYDGSYSNGGSIFLDFRNNADLSDKHSIIYGHNMLDGSMFGRLYKFSDINYMQSHKYIYLLTPEKTMKYEIFSQYVTTAKHDSYKLTFSSDSDYGYFARVLAGYSSYNTGIIPLEEDRIITLSTCVSDREKRRVLHAVLITEEPL